MFRSAKTLDDLLRKVYVRIASSGRWINPTKGRAKELCGVMLELTNPRARLSRTESRGKVFSCLGELMWYLSASNELSFIEYYLQKYKDYSDDQKSIHGGYGPRLFNLRGINQFDGIVQLLSRKPDSRQAVIELFSAEDLTHDWKDIPCTCTLQFLIRRDKLDMLTYMRSNDAYIGMPHDIFCFTMIQELMATRLKVNLGHYKHCVGSLHIYEGQLDAARAYIDEGFQQSFSMPEMPQDSYSHLPKVLAIESLLRNGEDLGSELEGLDIYWNDLIKILELMSIIRHRKGPGKFALVRQSLHSKVYDSLLEKRSTLATEEDSAHRAAQQLTLPNIE